MIEILFPLRTVYILVEQRSAQFVARRPAHVPKLHKVRTLAPAVHLLLSVRGRDAGQAEESNQIEAETEIEIETETGTDIETETETRQRTERDRQKEITERDRQG